MSLFKSIIGLNSKTLSFPLKKIIVIVILSLIGINTVHAKCKWPNKKRTTGSGQFTVPRFTVNGTVIRKGSSNKIYNYYSGHLGFSDDSDEGWQLAGYWDLVLPREKLFEVVGVGCALTERKAEYFARKDKARQVVKITANTIKKSPILGTLLSLTCRAKSLKYMKVSKFRVLDAYANLQFDDYKYYGWDVSVNSGLEVCDAGESGGF